MCTLNHIETEVENLKKLTNAYMNQDLNTMLKNQRKSVKAINVTHFPAKKIP